MSKDHKRLVLEAIINVLLCVLLFPVLLVLELLKD